MEALKKYSSVDIGIGLTKFLPEVDASSGSAAVASFLRQAVTLRLLLLGLLLVPLNVFAVPLARTLELGTDGPIYLRVVSGLVVSRVVVDLMLQTLHAFFAQFWSVLLGVTQAVLEVSLVGLVLLLGYEMGGVLGALFASSAASAPVFLVALASNGVVAGAIVFAGAGLLKSLSAYVLCRRAYGVRFPWEFAGRIVMVSLVMVAFLVMARTFWTTSPIEAVTLTVTGGLLFLVTLRLTGALGPEEIELVHKSKLPGRRWLVAWLAPRYADGSSVQGR